MHGKLGETWGQKLGNMGTGSCEKIDFSDLARIQSSKSLLRIPYKQRLRCWDTFEVTGKIRKTDFFTASRRNVLSDYITVLDQRRVYPRCVTWCATSTAITRAKRPRQPNYRKTLRLSPWTQTPEE